VSPASQDNYYGIIIPETGLYGDITVFGKIFKSPPSPPARQNRKNFYK